MTGNIFFTRSKFQYFFSKLATFPHPPCDCFPMTAGPTDLKTEDLKNQSMMQF